MGKMKASLLSLVAVCPHCPCLEATSDMIGSIHEDRREEEPERWRNNCVLSIGFGSSSLVLTAVACLS